MTGLKSWTIEDRLTHSYWILKRHLIHPLMNSLKANCLAFICFRQQRVVVNGVKSDWAPVLSGIPQGTVLGPLLFSLYINDISSDIESEIRLFADGCVCYREIKDKEDTMKLQRDIDRLGSWARKWGLNPSKALGPDELHPRVLKELATELGPVFTHLFQQSIDTGEIPKEWSLANICPPFQEE